jgi:nucleoside-diphosphate-sugar epimerase
MSDKIVITGGAGFIGGNLAKALLANGYSVTILDDLSSGTFENVPKGAEFFKVDVASADLIPLFNGASAVFHLAAKSNLADCTNNPVETARVNVLGTTRVLEASVKNNVKNFIYADTSCAYEGIDEFPSKLNKVKTVSVYACSKRAGALMAESFSNLYGLKVTTLRYFNVYGPAQDLRRVVPPVIAAFSFRLLKKENPLLFGDGSKRRDFIHVDDVNRFHLKILKDASVQGGTYNIGSGVNYSVLEIFDLIESNVQSGCHPIYKPDQPTEATITRSR